MRTSGSVRDEMVWASLAYAATASSPDVRLEHGECLGALRKRHVVVVAGERDVVHRLQEPGLAAKGLVDGLRRDRRLVGHEPDGGAGEPTIQEGRAGRGDDAGVRRPGPGRVRCCRRPHLLPSKSRLR